MECSFEPINRSVHLLNFILLTFRNQGSVYKNAFSSNAQSRSLSVVFDGVLISISVVLEATHESRAIEGRRVSSKSPSRVQNGDDGVAGRNYTANYFPANITVILCPHNIPAAISSASNNVHVFPTFYAAFDINHFYLQTLLHFGPANSTVIGTVFFTSFCF